MKSFKPWIFLMSIFLVSCQLQESLKNVSVEETSLNEAGIELEQVFATEIKISIDDQLVQTPFQQIGRMMGMSVKDESNHHSRYFSISNAEIQKILKSKIGLSYYKMVDLYQDAMMNKKSIEMIPELGVLYQFRANVLDDPVEDTVTFKLSEALAGKGVLIHLDNQRIKAFWGKNRVNPKDDEEKFDLFNIPDNANAFRMNEQDWIVFSKKPGAKLYFVRFMENAFQAYRLELNLPEIDGEVQVQTLRMSSAHLKVGGSGKLNGMMVIYSDPESIVRKIYLMKSNFTFKDETLRCERFLEYDLLPETLNCPGRPIVERLDERMNGSVYELHQ